MLRGAGLAVGVLTTVIAGGAAIADPLAARSDAGTALASPLKAVTYVTDTPDEAAALYRDAFDMAVLRLELTDARRAAYAELLGAEPAALASIAYAHRPSTQGEAAIRIVGLADATTEARPGHDARQPGVLSLGMAVRDVEHHGDIAARLGLPSSVGPTAITLQNAEGQPYTVGEIHFLAPHGAYVLGVSRPDDMTPVAELDPLTGVGGPAYSGAMAEDPDAMVAFIETVLGYEARRDIVLQSSGPDGGLGLPEGAQLRFAQLFAPGSRTGYVIVMGVGEDAAPAVKAPRPPTLGLGGWVFEVNDLDAAIERAAGLGTQVRGPLALDDPALGTRRAAALIAPNGQLVELYEAAAGASAIEAAAIPACDRPVTMLVEGINLDRARYASYGAALRDSGLYPSLEGYYAAVGDPVRVFEGDWPQEAFRVLARFPCERRARAFWFSEAYRDIVPMREGAGPVRVTVFEELPVPAYADWVTIMDAAEP